MDKKMFNEFLASVTEMDAIAAGKKKLSRTFEYPDPEVRKIRMKTGLSQDRFAYLIGVKPATLRNWEQGRRKPTGPAKALFRILEADPEGALRALHSKSA